MPQYLKSMTTSRRRFLIGSTATIAGVAGIGASRTRGALIDLTSMWNPLAEDDGVDLLPGVVTEVDPTGAQRQIRLRTADGARDVHLDDSASLWRDYETDLTAFVPGDEVMAEGAWSDSFFVATRIESMLRVLDGRITNIEDDMLQTTAGAVSTSSRTRPHTGADLTGVPIPELRVGDDISVNGRADPQTGALVALRIGVRVSA